MSAPCVYSRRVFVVSQASSKNLFQHVESPTNEASSPPKIFPGYRSPNARSALAIRLNLTQQRHYVTLDHRFLAEFEVAAAVA